MKVLQAGSFTDVGFMLADRGPESPKPATGMIHGVPQGPLFGLLLFLPLGGLRNVHCYADDT